MGFSSLGAQPMIAAASGGTLVADWIYGWTGAAFLTTLYGGVFSALGFFLSGSGRPEAKKNTKSKAVKAW